MYIHMHACLCAYIYIYVYICVCMCMRYVHGLMSVVVYQQRSWSVGSSRSSRFVRPGHPATAPAASPHGTTCRGRHGS